MRTQSKLLVTSLSVLALGGAAWAAENMQKASDVQQTFQSLDADRDGYVTQKEAGRIKELSENFSTADTNGDGKLVLAELDTYLAVRTN